MAYRDDDRRGGGGRSGGRSRGDYDNTNRGSLWVNRDANGERDPRWRGSVNVDGKEYWLAMWEGRSRNPDAPEFQVAITPKRDAGGEQHGQRGRREPDRGSREREDRRVSRNDRSRYDQRQERDEEDHRRGFAGARDLRDAGEDPDDPMPF